MLNDSNKLERDFQIAKNHGRWLSDDERIVLDNCNQTRSKLFVLTGVCVLLPPLWPFAFGLTLYLLFPKTIARIGIVATVCFLLSSLVVSGILIFLLLGFFNVSFLGCLVPSLVLLVGLASNPFVFRFIIRLVSIILFAHHPSHRYIYCNECI